MGNEFALFGVMLELIPYPAFSSLTSTRVASLWKSNKCHWRRWRAYPCNCFSLADLMQTNSALMAMSIAPGRYGRAGRCLAVPTSVTIEVIYAVPSKGKTAHWSTVYGQLYEKLVSVEVYRFEALHSCSIPSAGF
jgi:hypothetical protein